MHKKIHFKAKRTFIGYCYGINSNMFHTEVKE